MWYTAKCDKLRYDKPIIATTDRGTVMLLVPQLKESGSYTVIGYNWLRLDDGGYNSSRCWGTPQEAVEAYSHYVITNTDLTSGS